MIECKCLQCSSRFSRPACWVKRGDGKFCSRKCQGIFRSLNFRHSEETKTRIGNSSRGQKRSIHTRRNISAALVGKCRSYETRLKYSVAKKGKYIGNKHPNWKGGITPMHQKVRNSPEYANWRTSVFKRDNYTCQECGATKVYLNADHIKPFSLFPELRLSVENGRTLCVKCHRKTDTYAGRIRKFQNA